MDDSSMKPPEKSRWARFENTLKNVGSVVGIVLLLGGGGWGFHSVFSKIDDRMNAVDKRMNALTMAVKIIADTQGGKTKELVEAR